MLLYGFAMILLCFWFILIIGPRPIFGNLMLSCGFEWFSIAFAMFLVDSNRRPSPDLRLPYDFLCIWIVSLWLCYVSGWFKLSALAQSSVSLWCFCMVYQWFGYGSAWFQSSALAQSSPILWFPSFFSYDFVIFPVDFNRRLSPDLRLSFDFLGCCIVFL